ncbi:MAG: hypothetical protein OXH36_04810 [Bdellovibrionales bacterium]|nr:hypothetical protein [Bdellovibrionales bacterium]
MPLFLCLSFFIFVCSSCATLEPIQINHPVSKVFYADYQKVWRAAMLALSDYPIETEDNEKGYLKTEEIPIETIWKIPFEREKNLNSSKYVIQVKFIKGKVKAVAVVKVLVLKKIFRQKGFINAPVRVPSTGLEEKAILYRILREINIEHAIANYHQKSS